MSSASAVVSTRRIGMQIADVQRTNDLRLNLDSVLLKLRVCTEVCWVCCCSFASWLSSFSSSCLAWTHRRVTLNANYPFYLIFN